jgi:hypothetical protein
VCIESNQSNREGRCEHLAPSKMGSINHKIDLIPHHDDEQYQS